MPNTQHLTPHMPINKNIFRTLFWLSFATITIASILPQFFPQKVTILHDFSFRLDYILHFFSYFFLASFLTIWKFSKEKNYKLILFITIFGIIISSIFEFIQYFLPSRTFNPYDMLGNFSGFIIGLMLSIEFLIIKARRQTNDEWDERQ